MSQPFPATGWSSAITRYTGHGVTLEVVQDGPAEEPALDGLLEGLWWVRTSDTGVEPRLRQSISLHERGVTVPPGAQAICGIDGFQVLASEDEFYLTDGCSLLRLQPGLRRGYAQLAPDFLAKPPYAQRAFWLFGLLKLLRPLGTYGLHAAGVVNREGVGFLIIGTSASGKSTLTIGLIRQGWSYLSDDAVLLRCCPDGVVTLALRKHCWVDAAASAAYADLPLGEEAGDFAGRRKRRVGIEAVYPGQQVGCCLPHRLLFARLVPYEPSAVVPLDRPSALKYLLAQSWSPLFDRGSMAQHLELLTRLLQQAAPYELRD